MRRVALLIVAVSLASAPAAAQDRDALITHGRSLFAARGCSGCHSIGEGGARLAPSLAKIGTQLDESSAKAWIRDPNLHKQVVHSQVVRTLTAAEIDALAAFLASLR